MNFKLWQRSVVLVGILMGVSPRIQADSVTGEKSPSVYSKAPDLPVMNAYLKAHTLAPADPVGFSATNERGDTSLVSPVGGASAAEPPAADAPVVAAAPAVTAAAQPSGCTMASETSASSPCPLNFATHPNSGSFFCECDQPLDGGNIFATWMIRDPDGSGRWKGHVHTDAFGGGDNPRMFTYGLITQQGEDPRRNNALTEQYNNYFLSSLDDAVALAKTECQLGLKVSYVGASGSINLATGAPASGYQVQVVENIPGPQPDSMVLSPMPPGASDFCLTLPPTPPPASGS